ncbi:phospholipase/carboxylesterase [Nakamurella sp. UYEF19]|uniref:alpha/beta hydrolase n=1 Tax=Nakamurella sp. UYEF19 TaxID=1756392 RepID=UPI0033964389
MTAGAWPHVWRDGTGGPPLLMLHGTGGDEHDLLPLADRLSPSSPVLSPRGRVLEGSMPRFFRRLSEGVFDEQDLGARADELADFVLEVGAEHGIEPGTFVAVGFSNGANIASALMMQRPEVLAGAVLLAAMVPFSTPPADVDLTGRWAVVANGRRDPMATAEQTVTLVAQLEAMHADVTELSHDGGHTIDGRQLPELARIVAAASGFGIS